VARDDSLESIISAVKDLNSRLIVSNCYGKYKTLVMKPPHIVIFSNQKCFRKMMSEDRWKIFKLTEEKLKSIG
jgi:hypothetical protein